MQLSHRTTDNLSMDLRIIRSISTKAPSQSLHPRSLQQLSHLLKFKNAPHQQRPGNREKGRQWLNKKGINLQPLLSKLNKLPPTSMEQQPFNDNYFYIQLDENNLEQYLQKSKQYASMNLIQSIMCKNTHHNKLYTRILQQIQEQSQNKLKITWQRQRSPERKQQYLSIIKTILNKDKQYFQILRQIVPALHNGLSDQEHLIWQILHAQLSSYNQNADQHQNMSKLVLNSLKLVQKQFQRRLHAQDIDRYVSTRYLNRAQGKFQYEKTGFWAKAFVYMSAGMKQQFIDLLTFQKKNLTELLNAYLNCQEALNEGKPRYASLRPRADVQDVFYDQILFALNGESKYSCDILSQTQSLQLVWVLLRTTGIFWSQNKQKFLRIREGVVQSYRNSSSDPQLVRQMLYLLDFQAVIALGPNAALNRDDYLHLLLALSAYPNLINSRQLEDRLVPRLIEFILQLFIEKKQEYPYYVALIPSHRLIAQASALIVSSDMAQSFNWKCLSDLLSDKLYQGLVRATFSQLVNLQGNYLRAAQKLQQLLGSNQHSLDYLVQMLIRYYMQRQTYNHDEVLKAEQLGIKFSRQKQIDRSYERVFLLFTSLRELSAHLMTRDQNKLQEFIANNQLIYLDQRMASFGSAVLNKLAQFNGVQVYFYYLRSAVKGAEICLSKTHRLQQLKKFKSSILASCQQILQSKGMQDWRHQPIVSSLLDYLHQSL